MATQLVIEPETQSTDIVAVVSENPGIVLLDGAKFDAFYERMKAETDKHVPDVSTAKGRDEIRSLARRVVTAKTTIDKARLGLTKEWRDNVDKANAAGKVITARLDALSDEVRKPLTDWEDAEKARVAECEAVIAGFKASAIVTEVDTSETVKARGTEVWNTALDADRFGDMLTEATDAKQQAVSVLQAAMKRLRQSEADAAELEKLRAEAAEREAREAAAEAERIEQQRIADEARRAEEQRIADEQAARDREAAEKERIADAERAAAEQAAQAERDRLTAEHERELQAERDRVAELERAAETEKARLAQVEADRLAAIEAERVEAERLAAEQRKREANRQHRAKIMGEAKLAIMSCNVAEDTAKAIVLAIVGGNVPHVGITF